MFQSIPVVEENIFAYKAIGKLTENDYRKFLPELTTLIHKYGPISMLLDLEDFHGMEAKAAWEDYKFSSAHGKDFVKIAIVGEKRWQQWMTALGNVFTETELRYFEEDDASAAWDWLRGIEGEQQAINQYEQNNIKPYKRILAATDFSAHSEKALKRAVELAKEYGAKLSILNVLTHSHNYDSNYLILAAPGQYDETDQILYEHTKKELNKLIQKLKIQDVEHEVLWGIPKTTILSYAKAQQADLIVMGSHGRRGISRLIGSTTNGVINHAQCEVLSVNISDG